MPKRFVVLSILVSAFLTQVFPARATTVVPPRDLGQLARLSRAAVFAQAVESHVEEGGSLLYTVTRFQLLERIAGADPGTVFEVREPGGALGKKGLAVAGAPRFEEGHNYLLFLDPAPDGRWRSKTLAYGLLEEAPDGQVLRPLPQADRVELHTKASVEPVGIYRKAELLAHLKEVARGARWNREQVVAPESSQGGALTSAFEALHTAPAACQFLTYPGDGLPIRWFGYEDGSKTATISPTTPGQTGIADGGVSAVQQGTASWTNHPDSGIRFTAGSTRASQVACSGNFDTDQGAVLFNDPCEDIPDLSGCVGTLAMGGAFFDLATRQYDGEPWHSASSTYVVVNDGAQCVGEVSFREVLAHELGHTQGFNHHTPANPADALMSAKLKADGLGAALRITDKQCASYAYHTFLDVPYSRWSWPFVEANENAGIMTGCGSGNFCPTGNTNRADVAVSLVRGVHGGSFVPPPATGTVFADVPADYWAAAYIEQLYKDGLTGGCASNPLRYCPTSLVTRAQMATFLIRQAYGTSYTPPPATGTVFNDIPANYWAAPYIEKLYADGGTAGCSSNPPMYCPEQIVQREQVAAFLVRAFSLAIP
ncbi:MAG TPA: S-layer homology domain-containing protein [Thermoanaerobaculia bacterium]|nr:S-layer homology domain-containing protein [Thermoanaerobaculia bacterium]